MDKPCGCATAEQCFANCCCHTPTERLAWARAHNVEAAVLAALERRAGTEPRKPGSGCCAKKAAKPAYSAPSLDLVGPDICSEYQSLAATPAPVSVENSPEPAEESPQPRLVVLRAMLACGGIAAEWFSCGASLPPPAIVAAVVTYEPPLITLDVADDEMICVPSVPDLPPPRA
jgi:hypothetical protein